MTQGISSGLGTSSTVRRARLRTRARRTGIWLAVLALHFAPPVSADEGSSGKGPAPKQENPDFSIVTERQQVRLPASKKLRVVNHLGDVRARRAKGSDLNVISIVQRFKKDQTDAKTQIKTEGDQVEITTSYPSAVAGEGERQGRIDLSLLIPHGADLIVETVDGMIEIKGVHRRIEAQSESGRIRVSTGRRLKAHTDTGTLGITLGSPTRTESAELSTLTGVIQVDFAASPMPSFRAQTKGQINAIHIDDEPSLMEGSTDVLVLESGKKPHNLLIQSQDGNIFMRALDRPRKGGGPKAIQPEIKAEPEQTPPQPPSPS